MTVSARSANNPTRSANQGPVNQGPASGDPVDQGPVDQGRIDQGRIDQGRIDQGRIDQGRIDQGRIDQGRIDRGMVDMRRGGLGLGGSYVYEGDRLVTGWHSHDMHQIEYAVGGVVEVQTASAKYLLPPQQAAWIPAGLEHETTINTAVRTVAVLFDPELIPQPGNRARVLAVSPLVREMMIYAVRWPIDRAEPDPVSDGFFRTLGHLVFDALDHEAPLSLPTSADPLVAAAMAYTQDNLGSITAAEVSRAVRVSERTLRRRFRSTIGLSWRSYLLQARLLRAMAMLAAPGRSVLDVSTTVGFESVSAFARAFAQCCGETPSSYRRRVSTPKDSTGQVARLARETCGYAATSRRAWLVGSPPQ